MEQPLLAPARPLLLIIALFLALGTVYTWQVPPFEGPDEGEHFAYIEWLVVDKGFPPQGEAAWDTPVRQEAGQPPLYYLLASLPARLVGVDDPPAEYRPNPYAFSGTFTGNLSDNQNRALHYPGDTASLRGGWLALYLARALTLTFGALLLLGIYGLGRQVAPATPHLAVVATLLVAVTPQVLFVSSVVSNDIPAAALSTLSLWLLAVMIRRGPDWRLAALAGAFFGLAVLTKVSALALGPALGLGVAWLGWSRRHARARVAGSGLGLALAALLAAGWWFLRSWRLYGSPLGLAAHDQTPWAITDPALLAEPLARWYEVWRSFWVALGWGPIRPAAWVYTVLSLLGLAAVAGLALAFWRWQARGRLHHARVVLLSLLLIALLFTAIFLEVWMRRVIAPYGRLLFPAIATVAIFLALGWRAIHPKLPWLSIAFVATLALLAPSLLLQPAYHPNVLLGEAEAAALQPASAYTFATPDGQPIAELLSSELLEHNVPAGHYLPVRLCWRVLAQPRRHYTVLLHVIGPENSLITSRRTYPGLGHYPAPLWQPGTAFCDVVGVMIWKNLAETLVYRIEVGLLDEQDETRLTIYDAGGREVSNLFVGNARLLAQGQLETASLSGEGPVQLLDYDVVPAWQAGRTYHLTLRWSMAQQVEKDYQVFVHLRDPQTGQNVAQADGPPLDGWYPTSWWAAAEVVVDRRTFSLPDDVPAGRYNLVVGFYDLATGQRFGQEYFLGTIEVRS